MHEFPDPLPPNEHVPFDYDALSPGSDGDTLETESDGALIGCEQITDDPSLDAYSAGQTFTTKVAARIAAGDRSIIMHRVTPDELEPLAPTDERKTRYFAQYAAVTKPIIDRVKYVNDRLFYHNTPEYEETVSKIPGFRAVSQQGTVVTEIAPGLLLKVDPDYDAEDIQDYALARQRAQGIPGTEQLEAACDEPGNLAVVVHDVPGSRLNELTAEQRSEIPDAHFERFLDTLEAMYAVDLCPDLDVASNVIHDPSSEQGLTIVDYETLECEIAGEHLQLEFYPRRTVIGYAASFGAYTLIHDLQPGAAVPDYAIRFYTVCKQRFGDAADCIVDEWREKGFVYNP